MGVCAATVLRCVASEGRLGATVEQRRGGAGKSGLCRGERGWGGRLIHVQCGVSSMAQQGGESSTGEAHAWGLGGRRMNVAVQTEDKW